MIARVGKRARAAGAVKN